MKVEIELSEEQQREATRGFIENISDANLTWLLKQIVRQNLHVRNHLETAKQFQKIVKQECNL